MTTEIEQAQQLLEQAGYRVTAPPERPPAVCQVCGLDMDDEYLVDFSLDIAMGEEGGVSVVFYRCPDHLEEALEVLTEKLKLVTHYHGSTNYLEDPWCPPTGGKVGHDPCPTPARGNVVTLTDTGFWEPKSRW